MATSRIEMKHGIYRRIYSDGIQHGRRINACSIGAEFWLLRCLAASDGYLVFPADPEECRWHAAPRRNEITVKQVTEWLDELAEAGLILRYASPDDSERRYAVMLNCPPQPAARNGSRVSKWPTPPEHLAVWDDAGVWSMRANCSPAEKVKVNARPELRLPPPPPITPSPITGDGVVGILKRIGVPSSKISRLAAREDLTAGRILAEWYALKNDASIKSVGAVLASRLELPQNGCKLNTEVLAGAITKGVVVHLNGNHINRQAKVGWNTKGVYLDGELAVHESELEKAVIG